MRKLLLAIVLLALPALLIPLFLFQPQSPHSKSFFHKLDLSKKKLIPKSSSRGRKQTKETDTLDSLVKHLLSAVKKNEKAPAGKKSSKKNKTPEPSNPVSQLNSVFHSFLEQLQTDENGKMLLELFQTPNSQTAPNRRGK